MAQRLLSLSKPESWISGYQKINNPPLLTYPYF